ncbi:MAG: tetratricopeptide repeat protein, partial [Acidobacteriota bacterium]
MCNIKCLWLSIAIIMVGISTSRFGFAQDQPSPIPINTIEITSADEAALRNIANQFFANYAKKDLNSFMGLWSEHSPDFASRKQVMKKLFLNTESIELNSLTILQIELDREQAKVRVNIDIRGVDVNTGKPAVGLGKLIRTLQFKKEESVWKVWRYYPAAEDLAITLIAAKTEDERKALLAREKELVTSELASLVGQQGYIHFGKGDYDKAFAIYQLTIGIAEQIGDKAIIAHTLSNMGSMQARQGNYQEALAYYQQNLNISETLGNRPAIALALNNIGSIHNDQGDYQMALGYYQKGLAISEALNDKPSIAAILGNIGVVYNKRDDYLQALIYYRKSLAIREALNDKTGIASILSNIGIIYDKQGDYQQALVYYQKSLTIRENLNDRPGIAIALGNIGNIYKTQRNFQQALDYYHKSLAISETLGNRSGVAATLISIGIVYAEQGDYQQALDCYQKGLMISETLGNRSSVGLLLHNIANVHYHLGDFQQAVAFSKLSTEIFSQIGELDELWRAFTTLGAAFRRMGQLAQAREAFEKALTTIEKLRFQVVGGEQEQQRFFENRLSAYKQLVDLLISQNNNVEALTYLERAKARALLDVMQ